MTVRRVVVGWLALVVQALVIGAPAVIWGWWGLLLGASLLLLANATFELGRSVSNQDRTPDVPDPAKEPS